MHETEKIVNIVLEMLSIATNNKYQIVYLSRYLFEYMPLNLFVTITLKYKIVMIIDYNKSVFEYGFTKSDDLISDVDNFFK
jgi:hypothetical protein